MQWGSTELIDAACQLLYPAEALEVLLLDDSNDGTTALALASIERYQARGVNIRLIQRPNRKGNKAGNLVNGIRQASGELLAVFDADFAPPEDFLMQVC